MKKLFVGIVAIAMYGAPAFAAELPLKADPLFNWTGWYLGINTGYSWGRSRVTINNTAVDFNQSVQHRGWLVSGEGGYCWQTQSAAVTCVELRYDFPKERSRRVTIDIPPGTTTDNQTEIDPFLIGPHFGFLTDRNRTMWYLAGGLAVGQVGGNSIAVGPGGPGTADAGNKWKAGGFIGIGVERMVDQHWSWKVEYDYVRFASGKGATAPYNNPNIRDLPPGSTASFGGNAYDNIITVGLNYHFGSR